MNLQLLPSQLAEMVPTDFDYDYALRVPGMSSVSIILTMILLIAVPVLIFLYIKHRFPFQAISIIYGLLASMIGGTLLPQVLLVALQYIPGVTDFFNANPYIYWIFALIVMIGFETAALYIALRLAFKRSENGFSSAVLLSAAFGLVSILMIAVMNLAQYLLMILSINNGSMESMVASMIEAGSTAEEIQASLDSVTQFITQTSPINFLGQGLDTLIPSLIQIGTAVLMAPFLLKKAPVKNLLLALAMEALYCLSSILYYVGILPGIWAELACYAVVAVLAFYLALRGTKQYLPEDYKTLIGKPNENQKGGPGGKKDDPPHKMPKIVMPKD